MSETLPDEKEPQYISDFTYLVQYWMEEFVGRLKRQKAGLDEVENAERGLELANRSHVDTFPMEN